jgi:drug/metabolite transporter (DMT)-like permease
MPSAELLLILLGLSSAFSWGAGDFSGGLASKRTSAYTVVVLSQFVSLLILLFAVFLVTPEAFTTQAAIWGGIAGVCGALGLVALYSGLARGPMGVVAPLTAVIAAIVPVVFSIFQIGLPAASDLIGIIVALGAVWIISSGNNLAKINFKDLALPLLAGLGFGLFFILIARASTESTIWPLVFARTSSVIFIFLVGLLLGKNEIPQRSQVPLIALAGIFDTAGNILFILATRFGRLDIAAVLSSLYPAATVFLAWMVLKEGLTTRQWIGVVLVILAVVLIAI